MAADIEDLIVEARTQAGTSNFGDESFREPLEILVRAIETEADLTDDAVKAQLAELVPQLVTRLKIHGFVDRFPEIVEQPIVAPVIIVGPQRSGTSKLFRLIAADPQWNVLLTWQALNPVPLTDERLEGEDPRIAAAEEWVEKMKWMQPGHTLDARAPEMEAFLVAGSFMVNSPTRIVPTHRRYLESADYRPVYEYLKTQLQFLQWQTRAEPGRRWILKSPTHLPNVAALAEVFPDATLVMTHRHPKVNVTSMLKLVELAQANYAKTVDRERIRDMWLRILSFNVQRFMEFSDAGGDRMVVHVSYPEVLHDSMAAVRRIYERAGAPVTAETEAKVATWEAEHPQHVKGDFTYDMADYSLSEADIEREFAVYIHRFHSMF